MVGAHGRLLGVFLLGDDNAGSFDGVNVVWASQSGHRLGKHLDERDAARAAEAERVAAGWPPGMRVNGHRAPVDGHPPLPYTAEPEEWAGLIEQGWTADDLTVHALVVAYVAEQADAAEHAALSKENEAAAEQARLAAIARGGDDG